MKLYEELIATAIMKQMQSSTDQKTIEKIVHDEAVQALTKIKMILEQDHLSDQDCFW